MNYDDWKRANETIDEHREIVYKMSPEELASLDINQRIKGYEWDIKNAQEQLIKLRAAAKNLPKPNVKNMKIDSSIVQEGKWKFRGKRDLERKLYGWD